VEHFLRSLENSWQPFVLVIGLLLVGHSAASEGLFDWLGRLIARTPGGALRVFVVTMLAVAVVTATLNLDTAIVFMTPVALQAARSSKADQDAFLYGTILMTNSASLLLYGSNLTNLLVFSSRSVAGTTFASHMLLPWVGAVVITIAVVGLWRWRSFRGGVVVRSSSGLSFRFGIGALAVLLSVAAMLALRDPALPVLVIGVMAAGNEVLVKRKMRVREVLASPARTCWVRSSRWRFWWAGWAQLAPGRTLGRSHVLVGHVADRGGNVLGHQQSSGRVTVLRSVDCPPVCTAFGSESRPEHLRDRITVVHAVVPPRAIRGCASFATDLRHDWAPGSLVNDIRGVSVRLGRTTSNVRILVVERTLAPLRLRRQHSSPSSNLVRVFACPTCFPESTINDWPLLKCWRGSVPRSGRRHRCAKDGPSTKWWPT